MKINIIPTKKNFPKILIILGITILLFIGFVFLNQSNHYSYTYKTFRQNIVKLEIPNNLYILSESEFIKTILLKGKSKSDSQILINIDSLPKGFAGTRFESELETYNNRIYTKYVFYDPENKDEKRPLSVMYLTEINKSTDFISFVIIGINFDDKTKALTYKKKEDVEEADNITKNILQSLVIVNKH